MGWISLSAVYFIIWWVVFLAVLPVGVRRHQDKTPGLEPGAPEKPMIGRKVLATTLISLVFLGIFYLIASSDLISFREMAAQME